MCIRDRNGDGRIFFAIPYEQDFTLIGTTDLDFTGDPALVGITPEEVRYLCEGASGYFEQPVRPEEVVWSYSGVRPLQDDGVSRAQDASRDYVLSLDQMCIRDRHGIKRTQGARLGRSVSRP